MTKLKKLRLVDFPYAVEGLRREAQWNVEDPDPGRESPWWPAITATMDDAVLWWVTEPMARLTAAYVDDMPSADWAATRPALTGILLWDGAVTSISAPGARIPLDVIGVWWGSWDDTPIMIPLVRTADAIARFTAYATPAKLVSFGPGMLHASDLDHPIVRFMVATVILALTPTVATHRDHVARPPGPHRPATPYAISKIVLREPVRAAHHTTVDDSEKSKKWELKNRHLVRGHWRQQVCGPNREWRKPTFVPPYIRGPVEGELQLTRDVHVWRR